MKRTYKIADKIIEITSIYQYVHQLCEEYAFTGEADFAVETAQKDIDAEREKAEREGFSDAYLETLAVYRKIADKMLDYDTVLFHGSAIAVDGEAYLFTAKSGTGKSTHTRLWRELFGERAVMINDDKPLIRITDTGAFVYGTPWNGKHRLGTNTSAPLKAVCVLTRAETNGIKKTDKRAVYPMLLQQTNRPCDAAKMIKTFSLIDGLAARTELYILGCNMEPEAARVSYEGMNGRK